MVTNTHPYLLLYLWPCVWPPGDQYTALPSSISVTLCLASGGQYIALSPAISVTLCLASWGPVYSPTSCYICDPVSGLLDDQYTSLPLISMTLCLASWGPVYTTTSYYIHDPVSGLWETSTHPYLLLYRWPCVWPPGDHIHRYLLLYPWPCVWPPGDQYIALPPAIHCDTLSGILGTSI